MGQDSSKDEVVENKNVMSDDEKAKRKQDVQDSVSWWNRNRTFIPQKDDFRSGRKHSRTYSTIQATMVACLESGAEFEKAVKLPDGEDLNEWLAVTTVQLFEAVNKIYGICAEYKLCTDESCASMTAGPKFTYLWMYKKPTKVTAPTYIKEALTACSTSIDDPKIFPIEDGEKFPKNFLKIIKLIFKRLFRIYGHTFHSHYQEFKSKGVSAHLNTCFKFFVLFALEFDLLTKQEMQPLKKLIIKFAPKAFEGEEDTSSKPKAEKEKEKQSEKPSRTSDKERTGKEEDHDDQDEHEEQEHEGEADETEV